MARATPAADKVGPLTGKEIYQRTLKSTVWIAHQVEITGRGSAVATGSGSLIDVPHRLLLTNFHVVGTLLDRAWVNGDMSQFQRNVQTVGVPAGGGAVFDVRIDDEGLYPFVSHAFAHVDLGQVGLLKVGSPPGTMSH